MNSTVLPALEPRNAPARTPGAPGGTKARKRVRYGVALVLVLAAAAGAIRLRGAPRPATFQFDSAPVDRGPIHAKVTANGAVSALVTVNVGSQVSGRVQTLLVDFGSSVRAGQTVATIDPSLFQAATAQATANHRAAVASVARAQAQVVNAEKQLARTLALHQEGLST
ncbi:MAG TPA: biotin/lipoyl-binding protein, partial [Polyangiaceae bacterium]|nr:biotin/lipoyl-binding protein [Polyangiaceae bacterium]